MLTTKKVQLIEKISAEVETAVANQINDITYRQVNNVAFAIQCAIVAGVNAAVRSIVENSYTDEEMERDLTLR
jgi:hypothetical protein